MELVEFVEHLDLVLPAHYFLYPCRNHATVFKEVITIKPLDELTKLGDDRDDLIIWSRIEQLEKRSEHKFLSECRHTQTLRLCFFPP